MTESDVTIVVNTGTGIADAMLIMETLGAALTEWDARDQAENAITDRELGLRLRRAVRGFYRSDRAGDRTVYSSPHSHGSVTVYHYNFLLPPPLVEILDSLIPADEVTGE